MKKVLAILILCALFLPLSASDVHPLTQWKFHFGEANKAEQLDFDDSQWENVSVPHDWAITKPFDMRIDMQTVRVTEDGDKKPFLRTGRTGALPCFGIGWYRTHLAPIHTTTGQRIYVQFDGAMSLSKVYLNGHYVGGWPYGYTSFQVDVTDAWNPQGDNVLAVRLNNKEKSSRWYSGAGLYRNVRLVIKEPVSIAHWGLRIATPHISTKRATAVIQTTLENTQTQQPQHVTLETILCDSEGKEVTHHTAKTTLHGQKTLSQNLKVAHPALWSPSHPALYAIVSKVYVDHQLMDSSHTTFGFRSIVFDPLKGMLINGVPTEIKGVCRHHDLGPLGAAVNVQAIERQILLLKEMGCNAIRTSHNPASPELLSVCDRLGMTVMEEAFDEWEMGKNDNGYHNYFKQWAKKDVEAMVNRDKNHPCIIMWSTGNEIREQGTELGGS